MTDAAGRTPSPDTKALMARALVEVRESKARIRELEAAARAPIAIIGMDCRFPGGVDSPQAFWDLLARGGDAIVPVPPDRWDADAYYDPDPDTPGRIASRHGGFIQNTDRFDAAFFGISPREAESMDPQHRLLLESAWRALENANQRPAALRGSDTGVFIGICTYDYAIRHLANPDSAESQPSAYFGTGNALSAAAGRISYVFGFNGPSMAIDTACSSSLVAIHQAIQALRRGECSMALAGGVNLIMAPQTSIGFSRAHMLAPDGRCKAFSESANGYTRGEGCALVALKRLDHAQRDGDPILAVIRGSAVNQDGASSGLTVPNGPAQQAVIRRALTDANVEAASVGYVEAHGTGTALGDPIEAASLAAVYGAGRTEPLKLGSVKTNIGHLEGAAGVAGLIKTVLVLGQGRIPASLHAQQPSGKIDWSTLQLVGALTEWAGTEGQPRRAAVSAFGFTGTNAHVVLEAAPAPHDAPVQAAPQPTLLPLSAREPRALRPLIAAVAQSLAAQPGDALRGHAAIAALGRQHFPSRRAVVASTAGEAAALLSTIDLPDTATTSPMARRVAFVFSADAPYPGAGRALYDSQPVFRAVLDRCDQQVSATRGQPLLPVLFDPAQANLLGRPDWAATASYVLGCALAALWRHWGIEPDSAAGHGAGAHAAAQTAGVFSLEEGLALLSAAPGQPAAATLQRPRIPLIDARSGRWVDQEVTQPGYWTQPFDNTARPADILAALRQDSRHCLLEIGPGSNFIDQARSGWPEALWLASLSREDGLQPLRTLARLYESGADPHWPALFDAAPLGHQRLPGYPFHGPRHWLEENPARLHPARPVAAPTPVSSHPLLGARQHLPDDTGLRFASTLSADMPGYLGDHRLGGQVVVPAAALLEICLAAGREALATEHLLVEDFAIHQPLRLDGARPVQTVLTSAPQGGFSVRIHVAAAPWNLIAQARVRAARDEDTAGPGTPPAADWHTLPTSAFYDACRERGLGYGPRFQTLRHLQRQGTQLPAAIRADIALADGEDAQGTAPLLHPALFDGCLQAAGNGYPDPGAGEVFIPVALRRLVLQAPAQGQVHCLAEPWQTPDGQIELRLRLSDGQGRTIALAEGVQLRKVSATSLVQDSQGPGLQQLQALWTPLPPAPAISDAPLRSDEHVLLLHPGAPAPSALAEALRQRGAHVTAAGDLPATPAGGTTRIVLCCPPLDGPQPLGRFLNDHLLPLARTAERLHGLRRLLLLTPEALPVDGAPRHPALAAAWGFARSWRAEQPQLPLACADADGHAGSLAAIAADLLQDEAGAVEERAYRQGRRHARSLQAAALPDGPPPVQSDRSYLITGGQGDIGRELARWLVAHGARHLAVLSRRPPVTDPFWTDLAATARIAFIPADVADAGQVDAAFDRIAAELPPLAAIFHAAGLRQDATLDTLGQDQLDAVLRPKTLGALNLFQAARALGTPPPTLVCISSIAASFGSAGQAHYAAANAWLDAFAPWARAQGVPALSLAFGPWDDTGLVRQLSPRQRDDLLRRGLAFQPAQQSLDALGRLWRTGGTDLLVYAEPAPAAHLAPAPAMAAGDKRSDSLLDAVARILRLPPEQINPEAPLVSLGMDSLMALELRNWCKRTHQADIPAVDLLRDASVRLLAERLQAGQSDRAPGDAAPGAAPGSTQDSAGNPMGLQPAAPPAVPAQDPGALSPGQTALWYLHRMVPTAPAYHIALALRVRSAVDEQALAASLEALAQRHDMLRSVYVEGEQGPRRHITATTPRLARHEARGLDDTALLEQVRTDYRQPFDLAQGPVLRLSLHSRADDEHVLLFALHHIAADAWSLWRLLEELRVLYAAARTGQAAQLPAPDYGFSDRVRDEAAYLTSPRAAADRAYWLQELGGDLPLLQLPTDHPRPGVQSLDGSSVPFSLGTDETAALVALARQENTTLYAVLLAAYHCLLHHYSGQDDILVGCPSAGRDRPEAAATVGYFVNPVVLRARFAPGLGFRGLLRQLRQRLLDGMAHQDYPFPLLVDALRTPRADGWPPVFQAAFVMQQLQPSGDFARLLVPPTPPAQPARVDWGGLRLEFFGLPQQEGQFDLTLEMVQADGAAHGLFKYDRALWRHTSIERMAGHFRTLLRALATHADQPVDQLDLPPARHDLAFWQDYLAGYQEIAALPRQNRRSAVDMRHHDCELPSAARLEHFCREAGCTRSVFLQAVWGILLGRYANSDDVVFGCVFAGGPAASTLPVRVRLRPDEGLRPLLARLQAAANELGARQQVPLADIEQHCMGGGALFDHVLNLEPTDAAEAGPGAPHAFALELVRQAGSLGLRLTYAANVHDDALIHQIGEQLLHTVDRLLDLPDCIPCRLDILPPTQRHASVDAGNATAAGYPQEASLFGLFAKQAAARPDAAAVLAPHGENRWWSYREVADRACGLGEDLRRAGIRPGDRVAIFLPPAEPAIVALLGILHAGACYVPIDPAYPAERTNFILQDAGVSAVVSDAACRAQLPRLDVPVIDCDVQTAGPATPPAPTAPDATAYVIYTSGSTGQPKGCEISHRNAVRLLCNDRHDFDFGPADTWVMAHSLSFDFSVWEIYGALLHGGRLVIPSRETVRDVPAFHALLGACQVSVLNQTPLAFYNLIACESGLDSHTLDRHLRYVVFGGDRLEPHRLRDWQALYPLDRIALVNMYGITETTVHVTYHRLVPQDLDSDSSPIGRPLPETLLYLVDRHLNPQPAFAPGELVVGGSGVGKGYLNRPELTGERFIANPFHGGQLYRSGDLGYRDAEGRLFYLGRNDHQVKIRGHRIEPGEIEAALRALPGVQQAVVLPESADSGPELSAYVIGPQDADLLRSELSSRLPAHLIPTHIHCCETFPLTANGKLDRQALLQQRLHRRAAAQAQVRLPRNASESALAEIWKELLKLPAVGIDDNFFSRGGDSIKSTQLVYRATRQGFRFGVREVLTTPTIAELATWHTSAAVADEAQVEAFDEQAAIPLLPMQSWFFASARSKPSRFNQAVLLHTREPLASTAMAAALADLVARHQALRLRFRRDEQGVPQAFLVDPETAAFHLARWTPESVHSLDEAIAASQSLFDTQHGPVCAALLIDSPTQPGLLLAAHHLVIDGVSWRTLLEDLEQAYRSRLARQSAVFSGPAPAYLPWAHALQRFAASSTGQSETLHWLCEDWHADALQLPLADIAQAPQSPASREYLVTLPLADGAAALGNTHCEALLLSTLADTLRSLTGQQHLPLRIDLEGHGRQPLPDGIDGSRVIAWSTALYPALVPAASGPLDARIAATARHLADIPGGGRAFGLSRHHAPQAAVRRALGRIAPAALLFNYLGRLDDVLAPESLFRFAPTSSESLRDPAERPDYPLEINAFHFGGQLHLSLRHDCRRLAGDWVSRLGQAWQASLGTGLRGDYGLTPMQQGMLFHSLLQPASGTYLTQVCLPLQGTVDAGALHAAWESVLERHSVLRHAFAWRGLDLPQQRPQEDCDLPWQVHDWRAVAPDQWADALADFLAADRQQGFDLETAPLLRIQLLQGHAEHAMVWSHHHLVLDGRSMFLVLAEVLELYRARLAGRPPRLAPPGDFRAFVAGLAHAEPAAARAYWQTQLAGVEAATPLPFLRRADEQAQSPVLADHLRQDALLPQDTSDHLRALARHHGVSLNLLLQALLGLLLRHMGGSATVVFGATVSAALPEDRAEVGLFINTIPIVLQPPEEGELGEWLHRLRQAQAERAPFEQTALVDIQACSGVPAGQALFDLLFLFENYTIDDSLRQPVDGLRLGMPQVVERNHFPLTLSVLPGERLALQLAHDPARYPQDAARLLLRHFQHLLGIAANAEPGAALPLTLFTPLDMALRHTMLEDWNATALAVPDGWRAHLAFLNQAEARPDAVAVRWHGESWSYGQLAAQARQVACALQGRGVGAGDLVGLCVERSPRMLAGLFGILLTGAAYVPLDPGFPAERLAYMLEDAQARLCLSESAVDAGLCQRLSVTAPVLLLDGLPDILLVPSAPTPPVPDAHAPMYVIYTSGSTGRPKGVVLPHGAVANFLASMARTPGLQADDRLLAVTTLSFDIAVLELLLPLSLGACVVLADRAEAVDPRRLMRLLAEEKVSTMQATPATWRMLLAAGWQGQAGLKVLCGGEALPADLGQALLRGCAEVWNMYGPTETTVWSAVHRLVPGGDQGVEPIGKPIANTRLYVLDAQWQPVPPGTVGELCIAGAGLALGYHQRPELTAERFVPDPFAPRPGGRMYRTGDLALWRTDGVLEFLGRSDQQVKLRGFRIEVGEIESVLAAHAAVAQCAVAVRTAAADGEPRLVAWYTLRPGMAAPAEAALRTDLRERLPEYMVPALFTCLDAMPLTPNGKIDRQALPAHADLPAAAAMPVPGHEAGDPLKSQLSAIWSELLGRASLPANESFFNLGGNSLQLVTLQTRIAREWGLELDIVDLFRHPTLDAQARLVRARHTQPAAGPAALGARTDRSGARQHQAALRRDARTRQPR